MEDKSKITGYLSTDGKLTIEYHADNWQQEAIMFEKAKERFLEMVALMKENDLKLSKPQFKKPEKDYLLDRVCPKCKGRLFRQKTVKGTIVKCENSHYDFKTRTASGCNFIEWPSSEQTDPFNDLDINS